MARIKNGLCNTMSVPFHFSFCAPKAGVQLPCVEPLHAACLSPRNHAAREWWLCRRRPELLSAGSEAPNLGQVRDFWSLRSTSLAFPEILQGTWFLLMNYLLLKLADVKSVTCKKEPLLIQNGPESLSIGEIPLSEARWNTIAQAWLRQLQSFWSSFAPSAP